MTSFPHPSYFYLDPFFAVTSLLGRDGSIKPPMPLRLPDQVKLKAPSQPLPCIHAANAARPARTSRQTSPPRHGPARPPTNNRDNSDHFSSQTLSSPQSRTKSRPPRMIRASASVLSLPSVCVTLTPRPVVFSFCSDRLHMCALTTLLFFDVL